MKRISKFLSIIIATILLQYSYAAKEPVTMLQNIADTITDNLKENKSLYTKDPEALRSMVDSNLLPIIDSDYIVNYIMLPYNWRELDAEQKENHNTQLDEYREALAVNLTEYAIVNNYQKVLDNYDSGRFIFDARVREITMTDNREIIVAPSRYSEGDRSYNVDFRMMRNFQRDGENAAWYVTDVIVEGVSLLITYRDMIQQCLRADNSYQQIVNALDSSDTINCR